MRTLEVKWVKTPLNCKKETQLYRHELTFCDGKLGIEVSRLWEDVQCGTVTYVDPSTDTASSPPRRGWGVVAICGEGSLDRAKAQMENLLKVQWVRR